MSGDEWRISGHVEVLRKGVLIFEYDARNVECAAAMLPYKLMEAGDNALGYFAGKGDVCDQEGCSEPATAALARKVQHCDRCGVPAEHQVGGEYRCFCDAHATRGDCGIDDADTNYSSADAESGAR